MPIAMTARSSHVVVRIGHAQACCRTLDEENDAPRTVSDGSATAAAQSLPQTWPAPSPVEAAIGRRDGCCAGNSTLWRWRGDARDREERAAIEMRSKCT